jgi:probable phosphoglycerate mutase
MDLIVTIVRHGDTFGPGDPIRRVGARTDLPLVASGRAQADALGAAFVQAGVAFDRALTAPLLRSRETLDRALAAQAQPPAVETVDWLSEIDHGPDEGQIESAVIARVGRQALESWDSDAVVPDGWIVDAAQRAQHWRTLWEGGRGRILIVTSNGTARFALRSDEGLRVQATALASLKLRTGAYGVIAREQGRLRLLDWDRRP